MLICYIVNQGLVKDRPFWAYWVKDGEKLICSGGGSYNNITSLKIIHDIIKKEVEVIRQIGPVDIEFLANDRKIDEKVKRICKVDGCNEVHSARGYCKFHYLKENRKYRRVLVPE